MFSSTGGWSVRRSGAGRALKNFDIKVDAVNYAKRLGKKDKVDLYVHGKSGKVQAISRPKIM